MKFIQETLLQILVEKNYITSDSAEAAKNYAKNNGTSAIDYLLQAKLVSKDLLGQAIAEAYNIGYADLNSYPPSEKQVLSIPKEIALKYRIVVFQETPTELVLASDVPENATELPVELAPLVKNRKLKLFYTLTDDLEEAFSFYKEPLHKQVDEIIKKNKDVAPTILSVIIEEAIRLKASDIHFEPTDKDVVLRLRIDGAMREITDLSKDVYENILNRIKGEARMRGDDHFSAQDGAIRYESDKSSADLRVSVVPTLDGEKVAMRLLSAYVKGFTLWDLGLSQVHQSEVESSSRKPFGMVLSVGPTGSGKTTTLYAILKMLNTKDVNITTIEDPAEYKIRGINQIQVNEQTNLTFAKGLRSIVRQDPDIILVGEIRDEETAEIAVNAALTGHLLLSTFHANDAATAIPRLLDMHVAPFLLASTIEVIVAQRLVRRICEQCKVSYETTPSEIAKVSPGAEKYFAGTAKKVTFYKGKGCQSCNNTGFKGRVAVFEIIKSDAGLRELILSSPSAAQVWQYATAHGAKPMFEDGIEKVKQGVTTLEELARVAPINEYGQT